MKTKNNNYISPKLFILNIPEEDDIVTESVGGENTSVGGGGVVLPDDLWE